MNTRIYPSKLIQHLFNKKRKITKENWILKTYKMRYNSVVTKDLVLRILKIRLTVLSFNDTDYLLKSVTSRDRSPCPFLIILKKFPWFWRKMPWLCSFIVWISLLQCSFRSIYEKRLHYFSLWSLYFMCCG